MMNALVRLRVSGHGGAGGSPPFGLQTRGRINSTESCGTVDGPGIRFVVFVSGCPLQCVYCHNPETRNPDFSEIVTAEEVLTKVARYRNFLRGGGLTLSGGEPLGQPEFTHALLRGAKEQGLHTALDTSGQLGHRATDELLDQVDLVLLDIKSFDPDLYRVVTKGEVQYVLDFARRLEKRKQAMWVRFVLVPGVTDREDNVRGLAEFVSKLESVQRLEVLPFHKLGEPKYERLQMTYELSDVPEPTPAQVEATKALFRSYGITTM